MRSMFFPSMSTRPTLPSRLSPSPPRRAVVKALPRSPSNSATLARLVATTFSMYCSRPTKRLP
ncbi:hypothetical protein EVA_11704 [gut metagenome]|uniref:Secreted protein n=1 Tax=gut metagenome TaxID=749906 RepID=J9CJF3_9ZZZZ